MTDYATNAAKEIATVILDDAGAGIRGLSKEAIDMIAAILSRHADARIARLEKALKGMLAVWDNHDKWCGHYAKAPGYSYQKHIDAARLALTPDGKTPEPRKEGDANGDDVRNEPTTSDLVSTTPHATSPAPMTAAGDPSPSPSEQVKKIAEELDDAGYLNWATEISAIAATIERLEGEVAHWKRSQQIAQQKGEMLLTDLTSLQSQLDAAEKVMRGFIHGGCKDLPPERCVFRPGGTNGWHACCAARDYLSKQERT